MNNVWRGGHAKHRSRISSCMHSASYRPQRQVIELAQFLGLATARLLIGLVCHLARSGAACEGALQELQRRLSEEDKMCRTRRTALLGTGDATSAGSFRPPCYIAQVRFKTFRGVSALVVTNPRTIADRSGHARAFQRVPKWEA